MTNHVTKQEFRNDESGESGAFGLCVTRETCNDEKVGHGMPCPYDRQRVCVMEKQLENYTLNPVPNLSSFRFALLILNC